MKTFCKGVILLWLRPKNKELFYGLLHYSEKVGSTEKCREPQPDSDRWIQYCFPDPYVLGTNLVFIEFHIDWREWLPTQVSTEDSKSYSRQTIDLLARLAQGETFEEKDIKFPKPVKEKGKKNMRNNTQKKHKSRRGRQYHSKVQKIRHSIKLPTSIEYYKCELILFQLPHGLVFLLD